MNQETHTIETQEEKLVEFRAKHPCKELAVADVRWEYIACGRGSETLLLLNGGLRVAETAFAYIELFEYIGADIDLHTRFDAERARQDGFVGMIRRLLHSQEVMPDQLRHFGVVLG